jgi:hypothetical protein
MTPLGIPDNQWPNAPQGIADLLKRMDQIEPFEMTSEEEADWLAWRQKSRELELANFEKRTEGLFELSRYLLDTSRAGDYMNSVACTGRSICRESCRSISRWDRRFLV